MVSKELTDASNIEPVPALCHVGHCAHCPGCPFNAQLPTGKVSRRHCRAPSGWHGQTSGLLPSGFPRSKSYPQEQIFHESPAQFVNWSYNHYSFGRNKWCDPFLYSWWLFGFICVPLNLPLLCISLARIQLSLFLGAFCVTSAEEMQALQGH